MTTYSKETALYDTGAIKNGIETAGNTAKGYMTNVSNDGVFVHEYDTSNPQPSTTGENGVHIHNTVDIVNNGKVIASYGSTATVGQNADGYSRTEITGDGIDFKRKDGSTDVVLAHIGYATGQAEESGTSTKPYYTFGTRATDTASTRGNYSVAEGRNTSAIGYASHAEGRDTIASGENSHAEGYGNANDESVYKINGGASGIASHAEGYSSAASGNMSHAEGDRTLASGDSSHAAGLWTIAQRRSQTVIGEYNAVDTEGTVSTRGDYSFIIGNGTSNSNRSNALTVDWDGNVTVQNHSSPIGTSHNVYPSSTVSVNSGTATALCSVSLEPGLWLCLCGVRHPQANGGVRRANLRNSSGSTEIDVQEICNTNNIVQQQFARLIRNTGSDNVVYYLNAYQNSGSKLTYIAGYSQYANYICAVRIL